jgi:hypothetical protein
MGGHHNHLTPIQILVSMTAPLLPTTLPHPNPKPTPTMKKRTSLMVLSSLLVCSRRAPGHSVVSSPILVHHGMSAVPGLNDASANARPTFSEAGVLVIPAPLENSIGSSVVGRAVGSLTNAASKSLEAIIETVAPRRTRWSQHRRHHSRYW